ncbi:MAG: hypothetical protein FJY76_00015 [Candidatus Aenigmarchaeota archaeon]|nr:hypothetical protein [Candidatus Aenigmarchaeota archaeon]
MMDGSVSLSELSCKNIYVKIDDKLEGKLFDLRKKQFRSIRDMSRTSDIPENKLEAFFWHGDSYNLEIFLKIVKIFGIKNYEKRIVWIGGKTRGGGIRNPRIPFNFNSFHGGKFIAAVLGDGNFSKNLSVGYINFCPDMITSFKDVSKEVFGDINIKTDRKNWILLPRIAGRILLCLGLKPGRKTATNPRMPDFIKNGSRKCKIGFLQQFSDDEGSAQIRPPYSYSIRFELAREIPYDKITEKHEYVPSLLLDLHSLLRELGYSVTNIYGGRVYRGRKRLTRYAVSWCFDIQGKFSLEKFRRDIGFRVGERKEKLDYGLSMMTKNTYGPKAINTAIVGFHNAQKVRGIVTKHHMKSEMKQTIRNAQAWLSKLERRGLIERCSGGVVICNGRGFCGLEGRTPLGYKISDKGLRFLKEVNKGKTYTIRSCPVNAGERVYSCKWSNTTKT